MKKFILLGLSFASLSLLSCTKNDVEQPDDPIKLSTTDVTVLAGGQPTISLLSEGEYLLMAPDPDIAYAMTDVNGDIVIITSQLGATTIRVQDEHNVDRFVDIRVYSSSLTGRYFEKPQASSDLIEFIALTPDPELEASIVAELKEYVGKRYYTEYDFDFDYDTGSVTVTPYGGESSTGTYSWNVKTGALSITCNGETQKFITQYHRGVSSVIIYEEFTDIYKEKYPQENIIVVQVKRYLSRPILFC